MRKGIITVTLIALMAIAAIVAYAAPVPTNSLSGWTNAANLAINDGIVSTLASTPVTAQYQTIAAGSADFSATFTFRIDSNRSSIQVGVSSDSASDTFANFRDIVYAPNLGGFYVFNGFTRNTDPIYAGTVGVEGVYTVVIESDGGSDITYSLYKDGDMLGSQTTPRGTFLAEGVFIRPNNIDQPTGVHVLSIDFVGTPDATPTPTPTPDPSVSPTPDPSVSPTPTPTPTPVPNTGDTGASDQQKLQEYYSTYYDGNHPQTNLGYIVDENGNVVKVAHTADELQANGVAVSGKVTASADGAAIKDASVLLDEKLVKTGDDGAYKVDGLKAGSYDVVISADGFASKTLKVDVGASAVVLNAALDKASTGNPGNANASNDTVTTPTPIPTPTPKPSTVADTPGFGALLGLVALTGAAVYLYRKR